MEIRGDIPVRAGQYAAPDAGGLALSACCAWRKLLSVRANSAPAARGVLLKERPPRSSWGASGLSRRTITSVMISAIRR